MVEKFLVRAGASWGTGATLDVFGPSVSADPQMRRWWARWERGSASPSGYVEHVRRLLDIDVRPLLRLVRVQTLVLHRIGDLVSDIKAGRYIAERVPGARLVELAGRDHAPIFGDWQSFVDEIEQFASEIGDVPPAPRSVPAVLASDEGVTTFDRVADAARGGLDLLRASPSARAGLQVEMKRRDAAPEAKRLLALAAPGEALVTAPARGLLADAGLVLQPRGLHRTALESRERH